MTKNLSILLFASIVLISMSACQSPGSAAYDDELNSNSETMENLKVPADFKWNTLSEIEVTLTSGQSGIFQVTSSEGIVYYRAGLNGTGQYTFKLPVPSYEREVFVQFRGSQSKLVLDSGSVFHSI